jgi:sulfur transfer protein SufE
MGLIANLSSNRGSGIASMAARIRDAAQSITSQAA